MELKLTNCNLIVIIDDEDLDKVLAHNKIWYASFRLSNGQSIVDKVHSRSCIIGKMINLGAAVLGYDKRLMVDHINGNPLDNRKSNLRYATVIQNNYNKCKQAHKKYKGVGKETNSSPNYFASITWSESGQRYRYRKGGFKTEEEAALEYNKIASICHGEFARLNVILTNN